MYRLVVMVIELQQRSETRAIFISVLSSHVCIITGPPMGQYCFARWRLSSSVTTAGGRAGRPCGWSAVHVGSRAHDTARRASRVTSR